MIYEIVILAAIAAFLGLRLYSVLGQRSEQEEDPIRRSYGPREQNAPPPPVAGSPDAIPAARPTVTLRSVDNATSANETAIRAIACCRSTSIRSHLRAIRGPARSTRSCASSRGAAPRCC